MPDTEFELELIPHKPGQCEYCLKHVTVYAFALWVCAECLRTDPNAGV
jgi:hypothetical protein